MNNDWLTIALPKGKLGEEALELVQNTQFAVDMKLNSRKLYWEFPDKKLRFLVCRPTDIPVYVDYGAADLGIVGKDTIVEADANVFELVDLKFGGCKFVVAVPKERLDSAGNYSLEKLNLGRIASKFPNVARKFFQEAGLQVEVIKLHGNIELAPKVGLADAIVDIVSTGKTLKENELIAVDDIFYATARLIANRVSYRMKNSTIKLLITELKEAVQRGETND